MKKSATILLMMIFSGLTAHADGVREGEEHPSLLPKGLFLPIEAMSVDLMAYDHLDPKRQVPTDVLSKAVRYFELNKSKISNKTYMTLIDFRKHSSKQRMWVVNMNTGAVRAFWTSHGKGSDKNNDGYADRFSNVSGSNASSVGFYLTGSQYNGSNGRSMRMHGLDSTNSNAYSRAIVMHGADYVRPGAVGRSFGCPAIERKYVTELLGQLDAGSLLYIHGG